jgi:hypothetical protein
VPADQDPLGSDPERKERPDLPILFPKMDLGAFAPKMDLAAFVPKMDLAAFVPKMDYIALFSEPIDLSAFVPKIDLAVSIPPVDLSAFFIGVSSALFPTLDASALFPAIDLQSLIAQVGAFAFPDVADQSGSVEVDAADQSSVPSRQAAAIVTTFVFFIVFVGLTLMVRDLPQIAKISQLTGANPFDIAMGFGALAFWIAYSRRNS